MYTFCYGKYDTKVQQQHGDARKKYINFSFNSNKMKKKKLYVDLFLNNTLKHFCDIIFSQTETKSQNVQQPSNMLPVAVQ